MRLVFLGGLGEIGRNCFCLEVEDRILVVDCGLMFPDADMPGVDLVLPDFTYLRENADRVEGVVLTHAHEDHAGGLAFLLRDVSVPIYGSRAVARPRPQPHRGGGDARPHRADPGARRRAPSTSARSTASSSPSRTRCRTRFATAYHTPGRHDPPHRRLQARPHAGRRPQDRPRAASARSRGATAASGCCCPTPRTPSGPGFTPSESTVGRSDARRCSATTRTSGSSSPSFASHLHRVAAGRRGRARRRAARSRSSAGRWSRTSTLAREMGILDVPASRVIDIEEAPRLRARRGRASSAPARRASR